MVPCSSLNCSAIFPGTYPQALEAGWKPDGPRNLCPACAAGGTPMHETPPQLRNRIGELTAEVERQKRRIEHLQRDNARLQEPWQNETCVCRSDTNWTGRLTLHTRLELSG